MSLDARFSALPSSVRTPRIPASKTTMGKGNLGLPILFPKLASGGGCLFLHESTLDFL